MRPTYIVYFGKSRAFNYSLARAQELMQYLAGKGIKSTLEITGV